MRWNYPMSQWQDHVLKDFRCFLITFRQAQTWGLPKDYGFFSRYFLSLFHIVHSHVSRYFRPPVFFPASSRVSSTFTIILRPIWVIALSIFPLFLIRLAVGRLHPNSLAMPSIPYTYFLSVSVTGCGCVSVWREACLLRNMNSSPVICQTGFDNNSWRFFIVQSI